jgi:DNA-binding response OmpR family regulator
MKILVVDDEKSINSYLQRKLAKLGYTVFIAEDGEEALKQAFTHLPDIILLDVNLPKLNGIEVLKSLRADERTKSIPILILSARAQGKDIKAGLKAGANQYLCKPISFANILEEIRAYAEVPSDSLDH